MAVAAAGLNAFAPVAAPEVALMPGAELGPGGVRDDHYSAAPEAGGAPPYGKRQKPGQRKIVPPPSMAPLHSGVDELGFSTAWRSQPRP